MSTILAFDQSSHTSGWAVLKDGKLHDYGKFTFDDESVGVRLKKFRLKIEELINTYSPDEVVFEDIQEQNNILTFKVLAQVQGVLMEVLTSLEIPYSTIMAVTWKSTLGIKGKARAEQKRNAQQYITNTYGINVVQDIADAICIGDAYIRRNKCAWE